jgi:isopenicillin N synthase-like dioxygenase
LSTIPLFAIDALGDGDALNRACTELGAFELRLDHDDADLARAALAHAREFFALPLADKRALDIASSRHHRGFSEMHNARDWREQLHVGRERPPAKSPSDWASLTGPNQWPAALGANFAATILAHQEAMAALGRRIVDALINDKKGGDSDDYLVTKLICYHPQPADVTRSGVAAHVDYSLVTLLLQDEVGGLELMTRNGQWQEVVPRAEPGTVVVVVNLGELAEAATGGRLRATPHRVTNRARDRSRVSIPVFVNPPLDSMLAARPRAATDDAEHIHRVLLPDDATTPFHYGQAEWRRKGLNIWCGRCCADGPREPATQQTRYDRAR